MATIGTTQYHCGAATRRLRVLDPRDADGNPLPPQLNGIDYLEVANAAQTTLAVFFLHNLPGEVNAVPPAGPALVAASIRIAGGVRVRDIEVLNVAASGNRLSVTVNTPGDFSSYRLRLVTSATNDAVPPGFDPQLAQVDFSFKVDCASDFDCKPVDECPPEPRSEPVIDYLAKDYASFRRLMFDRLAVVTPDWRTRNPADLGVALVETLAYVADELSYTQDAVATEAYLGTARSRVSVRRHARLVDYRLHEGCNARAWIAIEVRAGGDADGLPLPAGTRFVLADGTPAVLSAEVFAELRAGATVFESMHEVRLASAHNAIAFHTWSDSLCCLPAGATRATLLDDPPLALAPGDLLLLEEIVSPSTGSGADADPAHRQVVRLTGVASGNDALDGTPILEVSWGEEDALGFPLCLSAEVESGGAQVIATSVARGNVLLADHGLSREAEPLDPPRSPKVGPYRPLLSRSDPSFTSRWSFGDGASAAASIVNDARAALPSVTLAGDATVWTPVADLLASDRFAPEFVVEMRDDRRAAIRFGDDVQGMAPSAEQAFTASYRTGNGRAGNVGRETLNRMVSALSGVARVRNPLPAQGGTDPETSDQAKRFAPQAFRTQERAVTEADYVRVAELHPEVSRAKATFRWTGSWITVFITVDRKGGLAVDADPAFEARLRAHLERYRLAGYDLEINDPVHVPLDLALFVCVKDGYFRSNVKQALLARFSSSRSADGTPGFFHPDNFSFGGPLYLSAVVAAAMTVAGVASVEVTRFQRLNRKASGELGKGAIQPAAMEILQLANDPNFPENGRLQLTLEGGL